MYLTRATRGLALVLACVVPTLAASAEVTISSTPSSSAFATVSDGQPATEVGSGRVSANAGGTIDSMCTPHGRRSSASAAAGVSYSDQGADGVFVELTTSAFAAGGHYRSCGFCGPNDQCVIITGHDTAARSDALASSTTRIEFGSELNHSAFLIGVSPSGAADGLSISLKTPAGETTPVDPDRASSLRVDVKEGDVYFLEIGIRVQAGDYGGCCESRLEQSAGVKLSVIPAPIIASDEELDPYIIGGTPVTDGLYDSVVGILIDGKIHCSGAVVGARTVLTAAHCIDGYETAIDEGRMQIFLGNSIFEHGTLKAVVGGAFPMGESGVRYQRTKYSIAHDVGLLYSAEEISAPVALMHSEKPTWSDMAGKFHAELTFVGFGLKVMVGGKGSGSGVKREATWRFSDRDEWNFYFKGQSSSTCRGDSGGPAFVRDPVSGELTLVGVTSAGDSDCTRGIEMRIDAHQVWFENRIR